MNKPVAGFSKLSKEEKNKLDCQGILFPPSEAIALLKNYWNTDEKTQKLHDEFIENTITNFYIPLGVALIF
jgi:hydroxymethylglutaryl-CoA reductase